MVEGRHTTGILLCAGGNGYLGPDTSARVRCGIHKIPGRLHVFTSFILGLLKVGRVIVLKKCEVQSVCRGFQNFSRITAAVICRSEPAVTG